MIPARVSRAILRTGSTAARRLSARTEAGSRRWKSTQSTPPEPSPHTGFWKEFGRPISKVLLMAIFTYQLAYYGWTRLEQDEIRLDTQEIESLESQVQSLQKSGKP